MSAPVLIGHDGKPLPPYLQRGGPGWEAIAARVGRGSPNRGDQLLVDGLCMDLGQALRPYLRS